MKPAHTMKHAHKPCIPIVLFLAVLAFAGRHSASAHEDLERGGVDKVATDLKFNGFSLDLAVGVASLNGFDDFRGALTGIPRFDLRHRAGRTLALTLPLILIPEEQTYGSGDRSGDLAYEEGPSVILAPSIEWYACPKSCLRSSIFGGVGVRHEERSAPFVDLDDATSPVVTLGFAFERPVTRKSALRIEIRTLMTFYDEERLPLLAADGADVGRGAVVGPKGTTMSIIASVGLKLRPGR